MGYSNIFILLICSLIPLSSERIFYVIYMNPYMLIYFITTDIGSLDYCTMYNNVYSDICGQSILCHSDRVGWKSIFLSCILMDFITMVLSIDDKGIFKFIIITVGLFFSWRSSNYCCHMHFDWRFISGFRYSDPFMWIFTLFTCTKLLWLL